MVYSNPALLATTTDPAPGGRSLDAKVPSKQPPARNRPSGAPHFLSRPALAAFLLVFLGCGAFVTSGRMAAQESFGIPERPLVVRSRVTVVSNPDATEAFQIRQSEVQKMLESGLRAHTGEPGVASAFLRYLDPDDQIGIKVNSRPGPITGTSPPVVEAVVVGLKKAGFSESQITIWDKDLESLKNAGYEGVRERTGVALAGAEQSGYDPEVYYSSEVLGGLVSGDLTGGAQKETLQRRSRLTKLVTERFTKIIHIPSLLNHNLAGVSGHLWGLAIGGADNTFRFEKEESRLAVAVPEIYAMEPIADKVALNILDALFCQYEGQNQPMLHYTKTLNQLWFGTDPVAMDAVAFNAVQNNRPSTSAGAGLPAPVLLENADLMELGTAKERLIEMSALEIGR